MYVCICLVQCGFNHLQTLQNLSLVCVDVFNHKAVHTNTHTAQEIKEYSSTNPYHIVAN